MFLISPLVLITKFLSKFFLLNDLYLLSCIFSFPIFSFMLLVFLSCLVITSHLWTKTMEDWGRRQASPAALWALFPTGLTLGGCRGLTPENWWALLLTGKCLCRVKGQWTRCRVETHMGAGVGRALSRSTPAWSCLASSAPVHALEWAVLPSSPGKLLRLLGLWCLCDPFPPKGADGSPTTVLSHPLPLVSVQCFPWCTGS